MTLQKLQIFRDLTEEEMQKSLVCSQAVTRTYQKNEYIFRQEDRPQKLYFILEGEVEVGSINLNGKITRMSMLAEGEYFGEVELFLRQPGYSCYARARKKATLLEVSLIFNMLQLFAEKVDKNNHQIEVLTSGNLRQRICAFLLENCNSDYNVTLHMNREELASYLNATRPSLSRMLVALQDEGLIRLSSRNKIQILDYDKVSGENG